MEHFLNKNDLFYMCFGGMSDQLLIFKCYFVIQRMIKC